MEKPQTPQELERERELVRKDFLERRITADEYSRRICKLLYDRKNPKR